MRWRKFIKSCLLSLYGKLLGFPRLYLFTYKMFQTFVPVSIQERVKGVIKLGIVQKNNDKSDVLLEKTKFTRRVMSMLKD